MKIILQNYDTIQKKFGAGDISITSASLNFFVDEIYFAIVKRISNVSSCLRKPL